MGEIAKVCDNRFSEFYNQLQTEAPEKEQVLSFIKPLEYMITALYKECESIQKSGGTSPSGALFVEAVRYIHENYMHPICCSDIAKYLNYSPSYIRYLFKKEGGSTVARKINEIRLENAKRLLLSNISITDIATSCGFCDSNYFSTVFKKKFGKAPREYKKEYLVLQSRV